LKERLNGRKGEEEDFSSRGMTLRKGKSYWNLKVEPQDRTVWRTRFGRGWSMLPEILILALSIEQSQET
jgi:hypothetical protein